MWPFLAQTLLVIIFWMLASFASRLLFVLANFSGFWAAGLLDTLQAFWCGRLTDYALAGILTAFVCLFALIPAVIPGKTAVRLYRQLTYAWTCLGIWLLVWVSFAEAAAYSEWKTKLDLKAFLTLRRVSELWSIAPWWQGLLLVTLASGLSYLACKAFGRWFLLPEARFSPSAPWTHRLARFGLALLSLALCGVMGRGGLQPSSVQPSRSHFSTDATLNDAAVNNLWNFFHVLWVSLRFLDGSNPFQFMPDKLAYERVATLHGHSPLWPTHDPHPRGSALAASPTPKPRHTSILTTPRPNIVWIMLESWSADLVEDLGGMRGVTPDFQRAGQDGLLFTRFYANGNRSQQGMASLLAGFPALPLVAVSDIPNRIVKLPTLTRILHQQGYQDSLFMYGSQLEYGNIKSILMYNGFKTLVDVGDLKSTYPTGTMGVHDEFLFQDLAARLEQLKPPFIAGAFTVSSHSPYDVPTPVVSPPTPGAQGPYLDGSSYTDHHLGILLDHAKTRPWWNNTLFIIVSDHSHPTPLDHANWQPEYRHVPLLLTGGALKPEWRGKRWERIASHIDIPATLLAQLGLPNDRFPWSKDLFDASSPEFAIYELNSGFGFIRPEGAVVFSKRRTSPLYNTLPTPLVEPTIESGKAYIQLLFRTFLDL
jgi:phosphoglycerol transferase MdoB-like AlkP superfamily enzyme